MFLTPSSMLGIDWSGWRTARYAPASFAADKRSIVCAPDVCTTTAPGLKPFPAAIASQVLLIAPSGVVRIIMAADEAAFTTSVRGSPAPMKALACSAVSLFRVATAVTA